MAVQTIGGEIPARSTCPEYLPLSQKLRFTREEAAILLSMSLRQLDYRISNQEIATKRDGKRVYITVAELRRYAQSDHVPGMVQ